MAGGKTPDGGVVGYCLYPYGHDVIAAFAGGGRLRAHCQYADPVCLRAVAAPHGIPVLQPAAVCTGGGFALHDPAGLRLYFL
ncbi:hypothetical protein D3C80_1507900 [compost metagenome]